MGAENPFVVETHGGRGAIWKHLYSGFPGAVIELDPDKAEFLARQRPSWPVYEGKAELMIAGGLLRKFSVDYLDIDPYGEPWPVIEGFFKPASGRKYAPKMALAVNDGLRQNARVGGAWKVRSTKEGARKYGNNKVREHYLDICADKLEDIVGKVGYEIDWWHGYYTGNLDDMTHYGAILIRSEDDRNKPAAA